MERCMPATLRGLDSNFRAFLEVRRRYHADDPATRPQLVELLPPFRWSQAKKNKDKIYGLLGLAPSHTRDRIEINYHISDSECYTRVMFTLLEQSRDLSVLIDCNSPSFVPKELPLPSWVPDLLRRGRRASLIMYITHFYSFLNPQTYTHDPFYT